MVGDGLMVGYRLVLKGPVELHRTLDSSCLVVLMVVVRLRSLPTTKTA